MSCPTANEAASRNVRRYAFASIAWLQATDPVRHSNLNARFGVGSSINEDTIEASLGKEVQALWSEVSRLRMQYFAAVEPMKTPGDFRANVRLDAVASVMWLQVVDPEHESAIGARLGSTTRYLQDDVDRHLGPIARDIWAETEICRASFYAAVNRQPVRQKEPACPDVSPS